MEELGEAQEKKPKLGYNDQILWDLEYMEPEKIENEESELSDEFEWVEDENKLDEKSKTYLTLINCTRANLEKDS